MNDQYQSCMETVAAQSKETVAGALLENLKRVSLDQAAPVVEFEVGASIANEYIGKLHAEEQTYVLAPLDDQPEDCKRFLLHQRSGLAITEIILHENGTWTALMTVPVYSTKA